MRGRVAMKTMNAPARDVVLDRYGILLSKEPLCTCTRPRRGLAAPAPPHLFHAPGSHTGGSATVPSFTIAHPQRPEQLKTHRTAERHSSSRSFPELRSGKEYVRKEPIRNSAWRGRIQKTRFQEVTTRALVYSKVHYLKRSRRRREQRTLNRVINRA